MSTPPTRRPKVHNHEILVMAKLADLYAALKPDARQRVHAHISELLDSLPTVAQVDEPEEELPLYREAGQ